MRIAPLFFVVAALASLPSCKKDTPAPATDPAAIAPAATEPAANAPVVEEQTATDPIAEALAQPEVVILDVRTPEEFAAGHVEGAVNLPVDAIEEFPASHPQKDRQIVVHCAAGGRSATATTRLTELGYTNILDAKTPDAVAKAQGKELVK